MRILSGIMGRGWTACVSGSGGQTQAMRERQAAKEAQRKVTAEAQRLRQEAADMRRKAIAESAAQQQTEPTGLEIKAANKTARDNHPESTPNDPLLISLPEINFSLQLVCVPAGEFLMGSDKTKDPNARDNELQQHSVYLTEYYTDRYPVTNEQYAIFALATRREFNWPKNKGNHPVVMVNWDDAIAFCAWLSQVSGRDVVLPSESQWGKEVRGTDSRTYPWGEQAPNKNLANYELGLLKSIAALFSISSTNARTTPVGQFSPQGDSPYGCADMAGNVWEWCADWYDANTYKNRGTGQIKDLTGPTSGESRVVRGGSCYYGEPGVRSAYRYGIVPVYRLLSVGFRVVVVSPLP